MSAQPWSWESSNRDVLAIGVPKRLGSPNETRGYHWRVRHRETKEWELLIGAAIAPYRERWSLIERTEWRRARPGASWGILEQRRQERRRVAVLRHVTHRRKFLRDEDNLRFATKPLTDALKRLGLLYDDARAWLEQEPTLEVVAPNGQDMTLIFIERVAT